MLASEMYLIGCQMINSITQLLCSAQTSEKTAMRVFTMISPGIRWICGNKFPFLLHKDFIWSSLPIKKWQILFLLISNYNQAGFHFTDRFKFFINLGFLLLHDILSTFDLMLLLDFSVLHLENVWRD